MNLREARLEISGIDFQLLSSSIIHANPSAEVLAEREKLKNRLAELEAQFPKARRNTKGKIVGRKPEPLIVYENGGIFDPTHMTPCCNKEDRDINGGCRSCGQPCY